MKHLCLATPLSVATQETIRCLLLAWSVVLLVAVVCAVVMLLWRSEDEP